MTTPYTTPPPSSSRGRPAGSWSTHALRHEPPRRASRVLVAEDDPEMRRLLGSTLRRDGYEVFEVENGVDLLDRLATEILHPHVPSTFDLVISDVRMPGVSGLEVLAGMRAADALTPFIIITAFGSPELHAQALAGGAVAVLDKPFEIDDLRTTVARLLQPVDLAPGASSEEPL